MERDRADDLRAALRRSIDAVGLHRGLPNEGVLGSSPSVGSADLKGFPNKSKPRCRSGVYQGSTARRSQTRISSVWASSAWAWAGRPWAGVSPPVICSQLQSPLVRTRRRRRRGRGRPDRRVGSRALRHRMKCSSSAGFGGPSAVASLWRNRTAASLLTRATPRQPVATHGTVFACQAFRGRRICHRLAPVATLGCVNAPSSVCLRRGNRLTSLR